MGFEHDFLTRGNGGEDVIAHSVAPGALEAQEQGLAQTGSSMKALCVYSDNVCR